MSRDGMANGTVVSWEKITRRRKMGEVTVPAPSSGGNEALRTACPAEWDGRRSRDVAKWAEVTVPAPSSGGNEALRKQLPPQSPGVVRRMRDPISPTLPYLGDSDAATLYSSQSSTFLRVLKVAVERVARHRDPLAFVDDRGLRRLRGLQRGQHHRGDGETKYVCDFHVLFHLFSPVVRLVQCGRPRGRTAEPSDR